MWDHLIETYVQAAHRFVIERFSPHSAKRMKALRCTIEHLVRRADGGSNEASNCVAACHSCNSARGTVPPDIYKTIRAQTEASPSP